MPPAGAESATAVAAPPISNDELSAVLTESGLQDSAADQVAPAGEPLEAYSPPEVDSGLEDRAPASATAIDLLSDVSLDVKVELGRSRMMVQDVLKLGAGSVVELDKLAGDPVDIFVNERLVARGEVLVLNDDFCVRISEIITPTAEFAEG